MTRWARTESRREFALPPGGAAVISMFLTVKLRSAKFGCCRRHEMGAAALRNGAAKISRGMHGRSPVRRPYGTMPTVEHFVPWRESIEDAECSCSLRRKVLELRRKRPATPKAIEVGVRTKRVHVAGRTSRACCWITERHDPRVLVLHRGLRPRDVGEHPKEANDLRRPKGGGGPRRTVARSGGDDASQGARGMMSACRATPRGRSPDDIF